MGDNIQNEIIERLAHAVQRVVVREAFGSPYYGLIADGTTDITAKEQFSCHLFYTDDNFIQHSRFLGYYNVPDTTAETLFLCIKDVFLRLNIPLEKLKGYCFRKQYVRTIFWSASKTWSGMSGIVVCALLQSLP